MKTTYLSGWAVFRYAVLIFVAGVAVGVMGHMVYINETTDTGTVMIDGKQWHKQRDSLMQIIEHKDAVNLLLAEKAVADSLRKAKEDSVAGVLATMRLERIARHDYRRFHDRELDSVLNARYGWRR